MLPSGSVRTRRNAGDNVAVRQVRRYLCHRQAATAVIDLRATVGAPANMAGAGNLCALHKTGIVFAITGKAHRMRTRRAPVSVVRHSQVSGTT